MSFRLLAVGDIHLGRHPSRLPEDLSAEATDLAPAGAWRRLVERAIQQRVHAVLLAGDVVEREDDFYEAYRELSRGVHRLAEAGIHVLGVAGNHDVKVLPRLADQLGPFRLIGRGGEWETVTLRANDEIVTVHGWSFRDEQVRDSPLRDATFTRGEGLNLGLLHCDRDVPDSRYAPVMSRELQAAGLDGWLLGHIHAPDHLSVETPVGYLGCVSGMDPGEPGDHGPWLFTVEAGRINALEQWVLAPLRWETLTLDLTDLVAAEDARARLAARVRERDQEIAAKTEPPKAVGLRVRLTGRTDLGRQVTRLFQQDVQAIVHDGAGGTRYFIERCLADTRPVLELETIARRSDPPGLLARRLCLLEAPEQEPARRLIEDARARLDAQCQDARWQGLDLRALDDRDVIVWLRRTGMRLLEDMLEQQGEPTL